MQVYLSDRKQMSIPVLESSFCKAREENCLSISATATEKAKAPCSYSRELQPGLKHVLVNQVPQICVEKTVPWISEVIPTERLQTPSKIPRRTHWWIDSTKLDPTRGTAMLAGTSPQSSRLAGELFWKVIDREPNKSSSCCLYLSSLVNKY